MAGFANLPENYQILKDSPMIEFPVMPEQAGSDIALTVFTTRPCKWYFVELLNDQWEMASEQNAQVAGVTDDRRRGLPSQPGPVMPRDAMNRSLATAIQTAATPLPIVPY